MNANSVVADVVIIFDENTNRFGMRQVTPPLFTNFNGLDWLPYSAGINSNNAFGVIAQLSLNTNTNPINEVYAVNPPIGVTITDECAWRSLLNNLIQNDNGTVSIQCDDVGAGQNGIISYGNYNINQATINNCGGINALDACNITTNTTQIVNGSSELKINVDSKNRLVIDNNKTALYTKNVTTGPAGALLELGENTFTLGCYFANNGIIECLPDSMAMYGNAANSSFVLTGSTITTSLSNGGGRIDREILDTTSQTFKDNAGVERLKVDSTGVVINNAYNLSLTAGVAGQVLTRTGASSTTWTSLPATVGITDTFGKALSMSSIISIGMMQHIYLSYHL